MSIIYSDTEYDTSEIVELRAQINDRENAFEATKRAHRDEQLAMVERYNALLAAARPAYPTPEHLSAFDQIATLVHDDVAYGDFHGHPTDADREAGRALPACARFDSNTRRVNVFAKAPYRARTARRAWDFTKDEIDTLRDELTGRGLKVLTEWEHEDGIAFVVADGRE